MATLRELGGYGNGGGFDAGRFIQLDQAGQRQRTLSYLGQMASQGDFQGAEKAAWAGGQTDIAAQLRGMNQADHEKLVQDTASFALSADTPEKWAAMGQQFAQAHPEFDVPPFAARQALIDRAVPVAEHLKMQMEQRNSDQEYALQQQKLAKGGDGTGNYYGTPLPYQKPDGTIGYALPSKAGGIKELELPGGSFLGPGDKAAETAAGKIEGQVASGLPQMQNSADRIIRTIDDLRTDPGLPRVTGPVGSHIPYWFNTDANRAYSKIQQLQGNAFLQAYADLRGAGQITEPEGEKATAALNRLANTEMSDADYKTALDDFEREVKSLVGVAQKRAGQGRQTGTLIRAPGAAPAASTGDAAVDFRSYFGGQ